MSIMRFVLALAVALAAFAAPASAKPAPHHRRAAIDWTRVIVATPDGGFRMGNPDARVKLVEYFSFTCPHCAAFAATGLPAVRDRYVRTGTVSFEMRTALRDRADLVAATMARCAGAKGFFPLAEAIFAAQGDWETRAIDYDSSHPADFDGAGAPAAMAALATGAGLDAIGRKHGIAAAALPRCFADPAAKAAVTKTTADAWGVRRISGTPAFLIDDVVVAAIHDWLGLEPQLQAAING